MDKIFPGPVPDQAGVQIKLWHHKLTVLIQVPGLNRDHLRAFSKGFEQYSFIESDTPIPAPVALKPDASLISRHGMSNL